MAEGLTALCGGCCIVSCCLLLILLMLSFSSLDYNEYGLDYNAITLNISPRPLTAGVHFLGIGHSFIKFQKTVQTMEFSNEKTADGASLISRTNDGLEVQLEISFQYQFDFMHLFELYVQYRDHHREILKNVAIDVLSVAATQYSAYDFFMDRQTIGIQMQDQLNRHFQSNCYAAIVFFQLRSVDLPDKFENAIQESEVRKQQIQKASAEKNKAIVELETSKLSALYAKNVTLNQAEGRSNAIIADGLAKSESFVKVQNANQDALLKLKEDLKLNNQGFLKYLRSKLIRDYKGQDLTVFIGDI